MNWSWLKANGQALARLCMALLLTRVRFALRARREVFRLLPGAKPYVQKWIVEAVYQSLSIWSDRRNGVHFLNYGYAPLDSSQPALQLEAIDEPDRLSIQLYHRVASALTLQGMELLEVGCGRGGGSSYVRRYLSPRSVVGLDLAGRAIDFCRREYRLDGLSFMQGDAERLPFPANSFDAVLNVESSHNYPDVATYFREVTRVLRPGGYFLLADHRLAGELDQLQQQLRASGLALHESEYITVNVARALELDSDRRTRIIRSSVPTWLRPVSRDFAGVKGSWLFDALRRGELEYVRFVLQKPHEMGDQHAPV